MSLATLKSETKTLISTVSGIGTVDEVRFDGDAVPRKFRPGTAYWGLAFGGIRQAPASFGAASTYYVLRRYPLRLEGWLGFKGTSHDTADWETLCQALFNKLTTGQNTLGGSVSGFKQWEALDMAVDVVQVAAENAGPYRAHHCLITGNAVVYERVTA